MRLAAGSEAEAGEVGKAHVAIFPQPARSGITNMYLTPEYTMSQMMHVSGHKTEITFRDYIKLSSDETADEIDEIASRRAKAEVL